MTVKQAAEASLWSAADVLLRQGIGFVVAVILARLLMPADFGVIALLTFFSGFSIVFVQGGLSIALIQSQHTSLEEESAVFWWNLMASCLFGAGLILLGPVVADYYGQPILQSLMIAAAAQVVFSALGAVQGALLTRSLRFVQLAKAGAASSLLSGIIGVGAAMMGAGVWALAIQLMVVTAANSAMLWWVSEWRPTAHFRLRTIKRLFDFGFYVSLSSILEVLYTQGFSLVVGKLHGMRELGLYNRAQTMQLFPNTALLTLVGRVALPLFSARTDDPEGLRRGLKMANRLTMIVNLPMMAGIALTSDLIIATFFGEKWLPAAPILSVLAIGGLLYPFHVLNLQVLLSLGHSGRFLNLDLAKKGLGIVCVLVGSFFGIFGLACSQLVLSVIAFFLNAYPSRQLLGYGPFRQLRDVRDIFAATIFMSAVILMLRGLITFPPLASLLILFAAGATSFFVVGLGLRLSSFRDAYAFALHLIPSRLTGPAHPLPGADELDRTQTRSWAPRRPR